MLYSAMSLKDAEILGSDGQRVGTLIDAYTNMRTGVVEWLIVEAAGVGGRYRLIPTAELAEYDTAARQLALRVPASEAATAREAPDGIPAKLDGVGDSRSGRLHVITSLVGFAVDAVDGTVGRAADFLVDSNGLVIRFLVVDTRDWLPGSDKLVPAEWIDSTDLARSRIYLKITQARTRECQRASAGSHLLDQS